jgi:hypothetical protein
LVSLIRASFPRRPRSLTSQWLHIDAPHEPVGIAPLPPSSLGWRAVALSGEDQAIARVELQFDALGPATCAGGPPSRSFKSFNDRFERSLTPK